MTKPEPKPPSPFTIILQTLAAIIHREVGLTVDATRPVVYNVPAELVLFELPPDKVLEWSWTLTRGGREYRQTLHLEWDLQRGLDVVLFQKAGADLPSSPPPDAGDAPEKEAPANGS